MEYRDKFRNAKHLPDETFKEYASRVSRCFEHWKDSEEVENDYHKLADLIVRDQLTSCCTYLQEKEPKSLPDLVSLANAYQLAHKNRPKEQFYRPPMFRYQNRDGYQNNESSNRSSSDTFQPGKPFDKLECFECGSEEHLIAKCPNKQKSDSSMKKTNKQMPNTFTNKG